MAGASEPVAQAVEAARSLIESLVELGGGAYDPFAERNDLSFCARHLLHARQRASHVSERPAKFSDPFDAGDLSGKRVCVGTSAPRQDCELALLGEAPG